MKITRLTFGQILYNFASYGPVLGASMCLGHNSVLQTPALILSCMCCFLGGGGGCHGLAAVCDCGTLWKFHLTFVLFTCLQSIKWRHQIRTLTRSPVSNVIQSLLKTSLETAFIFRKI